MNKNKGFTLIELLVVIAIIGILSSVVLASLSSARDKGKDAAVKAQLAGMKAQAELFYAATESYDGVCAAAQSINGFGGTAGPGLLRAANDSSATAGLNTTIAIDIAVTTDIGTTTRCNDTADAGTVYGGWAVIVPLTDSTDAARKFYCVDNTGLSKELVGPAVGFADAADVTCN